MFCHDIIVGLKVRSYYVRFPSVTSMKMICDGFPIDFCGIARPKNLGTMKELMFKDDFSN